jgi:hypothetical protein
MATLIRTAKLGSDWGRNELRAYNIQVVNEDLVDILWNQSAPSSDHPYSNPHQ